MSFVGITMLFQKILIGNLGGYKIISEMCSSQFTMYNWLQTFVSADKFELGAKYAVWCHKF